MPVSILLYCRHGGQICMFQMLICPKITDGVILICVFVIPFVMKILCLTFYVLSLPAHWVSGIQLHGILVPGS